MYLNGIYKPWERSHTVTRVFVPVPDGMTYADAEAALADAGAWVEVADEEAAPKGSRVRMEWLANKPNRARFYVHRDDLPPAYPDADLIEAMARALWSEQWPEGLSWLALTETSREMYLARARAALAVVREHEATR